MNMFSNFCFLAVIVSPLIVFLIINGQAKPLYNIYNKYDGSCLSTGYATPEEAEYFLRYHFGDEFSYESVRNDFVIAEFFEDAPVIQPRMEREDYRPKSSYYKNRIDQYFESEL